MPHGMAPVATLRRAVAQVLASSVLPEAVVVSGDLVEHGQPDEYAELRELLAPLPMPVYLMAGNHDDRDALRAAFPDHPYLGARDAFIQYAFDAEGWRIVMLDSLDPGRSSGRLCGARLEWLARELDAAAERPVIVFVHHPPFETGVPHVDSSRLLDGAALAEVLGRHDRVERVICGHVHRAMHARWGTTMVTTCPSVFFQFEPDLRSDGRYVPGGEMPGYQLHRLSEGQLLTYTLALA